MAPRCLKFTEKVSFNVASEASYVYYLSGQKLIKDAKNDPIWRVFENLKQCYQTGQKMVENAKIATFWVIFNDCARRVEAQEQPQKIVSAILEMIMWILCLRRH